MPAYHDQGGAQIISVILARPNPLTAGNVHCQRSDYLLEINARRSLHT